MGRADSQVTLGFRDQDGAFGVFEFHDSGGEPPPPFEDGEGLQLLFGLPSGQYLLDASYNEKRGLVLAPLAQEIRRLQRRSNFRTAVPAGANVSFALTAYDGRQVKSSEFTVLDLSAGGIRLSWSTGHDPKPEMGRSVGARLRLPSGVEIDLEGVIRIVHPGTGASASHFSQGLARLSQGLFRRPLLGSSGDPSLLSSQNETVRVGIEFQGLSSQDEQAVFMACVQLARRAQAVL